MQNLDRRQLLGHGVRTVAGVAMAGSLRSSAQRLLAGEAPSQPIIVAFTKSFQDRSVADVCRVFKQIGLDGLDLTVRRGGHIEPEDAAVQLPKALRAARQQGLDIPFLTTAITEPDAFAEKLLATAAESGIARVKLGYYRYGEFGTLAQQMDAVRKRLERVMRLATKYDVIPCVHIHSGATIPSHGTQLYDLIRDFPPDRIGAYVDPLHMTLEGGGDGWRQGLDLLAPWIAISSVKNFVFQQRGRDEHGQMQFMPIKVPVADGIAPLPEFVSVLEKLGFNGPYSLHSEYKGSRSFRPLDTEGCIRQTAEDLKYFRSLL